MCSWPSDVKLQVWQRCELHGQAVNYCQAGLSANLFLIHSLKSGRTHIYSAELQRRKVKLPNLLRVVFTKFGAKSGSSLQDLADSLLYVCVFTSAGMVATSPTIFRQDIQVPLELCIKVLKVTYGRSKSMRSPRLLIIHFDVS